MDDLVDVDVAGTAVIGIVTINGRRVAGARFGRVGIVHVIGSRQVDFHAWRLSLAIGLPLERPNFARSSGRIRVGFGPFAVSWWAR